jgi:DNA-binding response OmpR family regulator
MKSKRKALKSLIQSKVVDISDYRSMRLGKASRKLAIVSDQPEFAAGLKSQLEAQAEVQIFDGRFSLEQGLKSGEWDGIVLDHRSLKDDALTLCEKLKKNAKSDEMFVVIISENGDKDLVRTGYEKGCDEWITRLDDASHLSRLLMHHLAG